MNYKPLIPVYQAQWMLAGKRSSGSGPPPGLNDGDPVSTWLDSSVNGNNATQTGSARPTFKSNIVNGHPVVRFTSAGLSGLNLTSPISGVSPWTCLAVMKQAASAKRIDSLDGSGVGGHPAGPFHNSDNGVYVVDQSNYRAAAAVTLGFHVLTGISGTPNVYVDGTLPSLSGAAAPNAGNFVTIGYDSIDLVYCDGDIAEIIIYNAALSGTDRANDEKYLGTKYGITVAGGSAVDPSTVAGLVGWWKADSGVS